MKSKLFTISILTLAAASLHAQNFNPQVEVTNEYRSNVAEVQKEEVAMEVPDSLMEFNYKLDYTVFDHPYKGSYEFKPYLIEMAPQKSVPDVRRLYLSAGAGYTLTPELDLIFSPGSKGAVSGSFYDRFRGWFGPARVEGGESFDVSAYRNTIGVSGRVATPKTVWTGTVEYDRRYAADGVVKGGLDEITLGGGFTDMALSGGMKLDAGASLGFGSWSQKQISSTALSELSLGLDGELSKEIGRRGGRAALQAGVEGLFYGGLRKAVGVHLYAIPKYVIETDVAGLSAGIKLSMLPSSAGDGEDFGYRTSIVYPDVHGHVFIYEDKVCLFADITGGAQLDKLSDIMDFSPFAADLPLGDAPQGVLDARGEWVNLCAGVGGSIARSLQYKVWGGYVVPENALVDTYYVTSPSARPLAGLLRQNYNYAQAGISADYVSSALEIGARVDYKRVKGLKQGFGPTPLTATLRARYNWMQRIYAGVYAEHAAARPYGGGALLDIPAWTDLGVNAEYVLNHNLSLWLRAGNLLGQDIWKYMAHGRTGVNITGGICLNIR